MFENRKETFMAKCIKGEVLLDEIDHYIDLWHEGDSSDPLHVFLGMTWDEYARWVANPQILASIIAGHQENQTIETNPDKPLAPALAKSK